MNLLLKSLSSFVWLLAFSSLGHASIKTETHAHLGLVLASVLKTRVTLTSSNPYQIFTFGNTIRILESKSLNNQVWVRIQDPFNPDKQGWTPRQYVGALTDPTTYQQAVQIAERKLSSEFPLSLSLKQWLSSPTAIPKTLSLEERKHALVHTLIQQNYASAWQLACSLFQETPSKAIKHHMQSLSSLLSNRFIELFDPNNCTSLATKEISQSFTPKERFLIYQTTWYALSR